MATPISRTIICILGLLEGTAQASILSDTPNNLQMRTGGRLLNQHLIIDF